MCGKSGLTRKKKSTPVGSSKPVFFDPTSHRLAAMIVLSAGFLALALVWVIFFTLNIYNSRLPAEPEVVEVREAPVPAGATAAAPISEMPARGSPSKIWTPPDIRVHAYVPAWSFAGFLETRSHAATIDVLMPEWFQIDPIEGSITAIPAAHRDEFRRFADLNRGQFEVMPVVRTLAFQSEDLLSVLNDQKQAANIIGSVLELVRAQNFDGICFDLAGTGAQAIEAVVDFAASLKEALATIDRETCIVVGIKDPLWQSPLVADMADLFVVLSFQEPGPFSPPAPLAPQSWFENSVAELLKDIAPEKVVIALGSFGMDWVSGASDPTPVDFYGVTGEAARHGTEIQLDRASLNSKTSYTDARGLRHQIWFLDAVSAHNQLLDLPLERLAGVAIWPIVGGDPGLWDLFDETRTAPSDVATLLRDITAPDFVRYRGKGPLLVVDTPANAGQRTLATDVDSGLITETVFLTRPTALTIARSGFPGKNFVVLTFDDGPDERFTPQILDILNSHDAPAVFFVIGSRVLENPDLARRIVDEGHELGVHTYSHPNIGTVTELRLKFELHASQELIVSETGRNTNLFRAPYGLDENPKTLQEAEALRVLSEEGYVVVGVEIDSSDWMLPGAERIVEKVVFQARNGTGNVILLHDGGGDRAQTVQALPLIIKALREAGLSIVPISTILEASGSPLLTSGAAEKNTLSEMSFQGIRYFFSTITAIFFIVILAGIIRSLIIICLALIKNHRPHRHVASDLPVTVIIPAYCEETVITKSIGSVLASDYPVQEVIVVDDGSKDKTAEVVATTFGSEPRVRLLRQKNRGKAEALNYACQKARAPVVVAVDADTIISSDAIGALVGHFSDPVIGAVAGNVKVGNRDNLLTRLQAVEYITSQNLDRRAFEVLNGIMVIPGAIGAWRAEAITAAGGFTTETLVEDADITVAIIRAGYRVIFEPRALAFTEAPETVRQWMRQRLRWNFGMLQLAWKHKGAILERRAVGLVSIPDLVIFGALFSLFAPIADLVFLVNVSNVAGGLLRGTPGGFSEISIAAIVAYSAYLFSDLVLAALAFGLERKENKWLLPWVLTQRFFYRQIYWVVALRSIGRALTGRFTGWRKITRTATVSAESMVAGPRASHRIVATARTRPGH